MYGKTAQGSFDGRSKLSDGFTLAGIPSGGLFSGAGQSPRASELWGRHRRPFDPSYRRRTPGPSTAPRSVSTAGVGFAYAHPTGPRRPQRGSGHGGLQAVIRADLATDPTDRSRMGFPWLHAGRDELECMVAGGIGLWSRVFASPGGAVRTPIACLAAVVVIAGCGRRRYGRALLHPQRPVPGGGSARDQLTVERRPRLRRGTLTTPTTERSTSCRCCRSTTSETTGWRSTPSRLN